MSSDGALSRCKVHISFDGFPSNNQNAHPIEEVYEKLCSVSVQPHEPSSGSLCMFWSACLLDGKKRQMKKCIQSVIYQDVNATI